MSLYLTLLAAAAQLEANVPMAAMKPFMDYTVCLFDPLNKLIAGLPPLKSDREKIVTRQLEACAKVRATSIQAATAAVRSTGEKNEIERAFAATESQLRFVVVDNEKFAAASDAYCRERGQEPGC